MTDHMPARERMDPHQPRGFRLYMFWPSFAALLALLLLAYEGVRHNETRAELAEARAQVAEQIARRIQDEAGWTCKTYESGSVVARWCHRKTEQ